MSPPSEERLAWLTGFTGSAGLAIVLTQEAAVFVDGRYTLQAAQAGRCQGLGIEPLVDPPPESWLAEHLAAGDRLGFDPWLHTSAAAERLADGLRQGRRGTGRGRQQSGRSRMDRPPRAAARPGRHSRRAIRRRSARPTSSSASAARSTRLGVDALVLSDSHAVAWTFNIRGADVSHTPLPLSYALVPKDGRPTVFIDHRKLSNSARDHLERIRRRRASRTR